MAWKKHFQSSTQNKKYQNQYTAAKMANDPFTASSNAQSSRFTSWLPEVYSGNANRIERYSQYENMDLDTEINMALDTIADSMTEHDERSKLPFDFEWDSNATEEEITLIKEMMHHWISINDFDRRLWKSVRSTLMYGDQIFIRDPETYKLHWVSPDQVDSVIVDESKGKTPEQYVVRDLDANLQTLVATSNEKRPKDKRGYSSGPLAAGQMNGAATPGGTNPGQQYNQGVSQTGGNAGLAYHVDASNIVHLSLSEGLDNSWPFGISILENVFKTYKQMELIEDAVIIYRVQRAPERRVFYVDTGRLPAHRAMAYLERIKNEIQQKRIPSRNGGGQNITDATYNPMCISFDTKIPLLDGRTLTLDEIIQEYKNGKENWVYSCDEITGEIKPGNITWAGPTRKNAKTIKLTFDNGKSLTCTPDHKIPVLGKGFVEAQNLTVDDSLISFETDYKSLSMDKNRSYQRVYDHKKNEWVFTHRMVAEFFKHIEKHQVMIFDESLKDYDKNTVHHKDYDRYNNDPRNLTWMNFEDHRLFHSFTKKEYWQNLSEDESTRIKNKIREDLRLYREQNPVDFKQQLNNTNTTLLKTVKNDKTDLVITQDILSRLVNIVKENNSNKLETLELASNDDILMKMFKEANQILPNSTHNIDCTKFTNVSLKKIYSQFGYKNWKDFKKKIEVYNHKIVSIETDIDQDVGTITIDFDEKWHNHHTFAIESGIFIKNSMLEDYFFSQNSDGKGSRVETLPGGDQLGQIDDLKYFHHKIRTGLRVPRSYMPDFDDGGGGMFNDGRVGTAYIEELRFTKYCVRLQNLLVPHFDKEFKLFCKHRGVNIHSSIFKLKFNIPQNFSKYRQTEVDGAVLAVYSQVADIPHISRRFGLKTYAGLSDDQILENERMWAEENAHLLNGKGAENISSGIENTGFGDVGANAGGLGGLDMPDYDIDTDEESDGADGSASAISGNENDLSDDDLEI